jgi:hypothetical protein
MAKTRRPVNPSEATIQATKYAELCASIAEARARGEDFELRGAKQIALFRWKDERKFKWVLRKGRDPYTRDGVIYCLSVITWERWRQFLIFCSVHGLDPAREAHKYGFGPPSQSKH